MRASFALLPFLFVTNLNFVCGTATAATTSKEFLHHWARALRVGNLEAMTSFYENSDTVVAIQSTGHALTGRKSIRREYEAAFRDVMFEDVQLENLKVRESGDVAWATCRFRALTHRKSDASKWKVEVYTSFVLHRVDDSWLITLEQSTPIFGQPRVQRRD